jgi:glycosyltransferase involved in cell wall biosynthesis
MSTDGPGMLPYASVIIPTHDRAATLPVALASIARQTVENIEIIVAGDGPTAEVTAAAEAAAAADRRIRFLRFEKGSNNGGANRHRAVLEARSERIFYCDDDDLWLRQHVETIGPHLDRHDVVDTLPVSVGMIPVGSSSRLHGALINNGDARTRTLLATRRLKIVFDTHLAHRKSRYVAMEQPWANAELLAVDHLLAAFAADVNVRWWTLPTATALSLHGLGRRHVAAADRLAEIQAWCDRTQAWTPEHLLARSNFAWYFFRMLAAEAAAEDDTVAGYLARMGILWDPGERVGDGETLMLPAPLEPQQREPLELLFALNQGRIVEESALPILIPQLLDIVLGHVISVRFALKLLTPFGSAGGITAVGRIEETHPESAHLIRLLRAHLLTRAKRHAEAHALAGRLAAEGRLPRYDLTRLLAAIEVGQGNGDAAIARMTAAWGEMREQTAIGLELAAMLAAVGRREDALSLCRDLEPRLPEGHPGLLSLYQRLGQATAGGEPSRSAV